MKLKLNKEYGESLCNTIRQIALTQMVVVRPVGFSVGDNSTVIDTCDSVEEDMTEFISNVCEGVYLAVTSELPELLEGTVRCNGTLTLGDLCPEGWDITALQPERAVLHTLAPVVVGVVFRASTGYHSMQENADFLAKNNYLAGSWVPISSRHSLVTRFSYTTLETESDKCTMELSATTNGNVDGDTVIAKSLEILGSTIGKIIDSI